MVTFALVGLAVASALVCAGAIAWGMTLGKDGSRSQTGPAATSVADSSAIAQPPSAIEVPDLAGLTLAEARIVIKAAGLQMRVREEGAPVESPSKVRIRNQSPEGGTVVDPRTEIVVIVPPVVQETTSTAQGAVAASGKFTVVLDPGHQSTSDSGLEPLGPGSSEEKARVTGGASGVSSGSEEYEVVLQIANLVKRDLENAGVTVIMTRTTNDVSLTNVERAEIANKANADLFVRIHADSSTDQSRSGICTLVPGTTKWTKPIMQRSREAAQAVQAALVKATDAEDLGIVERTDLTGFNWSKVPVVLVESGFMSNAVEDRLLGSPQYQDKLARGMATGIERYLGTVRP